MGGKVVAVVMAGGEGKRLSPTTEVIPKPLIPVNGQPMIDYTIDQCSLCQSIDYVVVTTCYRGSLIEQHLSNKWPSVICRQEPQLLKTGGSLKWQVSFIDSLDTSILVVLMSDHMRILDLWQLLTVHKECMNAITLITSTAREEHNQVVLRNRQVVGYLPAQHHLVESSESSIGEYVFSWSELREWLICKEQTVFDIGWGLVEPAIRSNSVKVGTFNVDRWVDLGTWDRISNYEKVG